MPCNGNDFYPAVLRLAQSWCCMKALKHLTKSQSCRKRSPQRLGGIRGNAVSKPMKLGNDGSEDSKITRDEQERL